MLFTKVTLSLFFAIALGFLSVLAAPMLAQQSMGELRFSADTTTERDSGVWIDGKYAGFLKELKGNRKVMLPEGEHDVSIRQAGYKDFSKKIKVESGQVMEIAVTLEPDPKFQYPKEDAAILRIDVKPNRAAVFVDDGYMGHASDFGGRFHSMLLIPGKHRIRIELPGYQTFEKEVELAAAEKSQIRAELAKNDSQ